MLILTKMTPSNETHAQKAINMRIHWKKTKLCHRRIKVDLIALETSPT